MARSTPEWPTAASRVVGTIGYPVDHSLSPRLHQAAFEVLGVDWVSVGFPVPPGEAATAIRGASALGIAGLSVTMPHKADAARTVDELTPLASRLGAVTCVRFEGGRMIGDSTDGAGLLLSLERDADFVPAGRRCVVIGAGGAARAAVAALADAGAAEVVVVNRTEARAEEAARLAGPAGRTGTLDDIEPAELVVHATPYGMVGNGEVLGIAPLEVIAEVFRAGQVVMDLVYVPRWTPILEAASERGATVVDGLGMLVFQAAVALQQWTGLEAPVDAMFVAAGDPDRQNPTGDR
jgi:shikimate dehydrogenase